MSEAKEDFEKIDNFLRLAQGIDKFKDCQTVYDLFEITDKNVTYPDIEKKIESFVKLYAGSNAPKFKHLGRVISGEAETVKRVLRDHRRVYNEYLQERDPGIQKLREHFVFCTKRDNKLDSKKKAELIEEAKEVGLSDAKALTLINKWLIEYGVEESKDSAGSSATSSTRPFTDFLGKTYYEILGVSDDAAYAKIKDAYEREYRKYNTSRDKAKASVRFFVVSEAWECLRDPTKKREYDEKLKQPETPVPTGKPRLVVECKSDYTFKDVRRGTTISKRIIIKNPEGGLLQGTIKSDSLWLEPDRNKILEKHEQDLEIKVLTSKISPKMYKTEGHITIDTNGGPPYMIPFIVFLENYEIELQRFRKTWPPLCAAMGGLIGSFASQNHFSGFLIGIFIFGSLGYLLSAKGLELSIIKGIDLSKYPPVVFQGTAVGLVLLTIFSHLGGKHITGPDTPQGQVRTIVLQRDLEKGKDIWTTSVYSYAPGGGGPGGGLDNEWLQVGGWGDFYLSLIQFNLTGLPSVAISAKIELFVGENKGDGTCPMYLDRITAFWDWKTRGTGSDRKRLWWADRPSAVQWDSKTLPAPRVAQWYSIDITHLYNAWQKGTYPNYGVQLRPALNSNKWNMFYSSRFLKNPSLRPKLVIAVPNGRSAPPIQEVSVVPVPYEDYGVCSGEACGFGEWLACQNMEIHKERDKDSPVVFQIAKGEKVTALTGVVITTKPGRATVLKSFKIGDFQAEPGDNVYLLTYRGEGVYNVWFKGKMHNNLGLDPFNLGYLKVMDSPETIDWVEIQNSKGEMGWIGLSRQSYFDYRYGCGE